MQTRTAGDPDDEPIVFTDLTPRTLEQELDKLGTPASDDIIREWMDEQNLRQRKIRYHRYHLLRSLRDLRPATARRPQRSQSVFQ